MSSQCFDETGSDAEEWRGTAARIVAFCTVLFAALLPNHFALPADSTLFALFGLVAAITLRNGDTRGLGFRTIPERGWGHWCRFALVLGLGIGLVLLVFGTIVWYGGWNWPIPRTDPRLLSHQIYWMCVYAPLTEEVIYRSLLAFAVGPTLGDKGTILLSGFLFAGMHILGGNASPENQIAGFFFAWAFLRSKTILVPIAMHSAGNAIAVAAQVFNWYCMPLTTP